LFAFVARVSPSARGNEEAKIPWPEARSSKYFHGVKTEGNIPRGSYSQKVLTEVIFTI